MADSFQQYIKIRTFLGYRPKEILLELQDAFGKSIGERKTNRSTIIFSLGDEAPTYALVQRWSKRFRDAIDSPLGSPLPSQSNFVHQENQQIENESIDGETDHDDLSQLNTNAHQSELKLS